MRRAFFFIVAIVFATTSYASIPHASMLNRANEDASAFVAPLPETRIRVSDVLAPFERPAGSELTRALRQAYEQPSTTNASGLRRFLAPDPALDKFVLVQPQRWNRYAYVGNNSLRYTDPTGRWMMSGIGADRRLDQFVRLQTAIWRMRPWNAFGPQCICDGTMKLPSDPSRLPDYWQQDPKHRNPNGKLFRDPEGNVLEWHQGQPGKKGWRGRDHWHYRPDGDGVTSTWSRVMRFRIHRNRKRQIPSDRL